MNEVATFAKLDRVASLRVRFAPGFRQILAAHVEPLRAAAGDRPLVEIGSGDGYLLRNLPANVKMTHTEPTAIGVSRLRERHPDVEVCRASAESLPWGQKSVGGIVACCVLDVVPDLDAALRECARVLAPGASLVHFLDLATDLRALMRAAAAEGEQCVLPNVFTDPMSAPWPEDLFFVSRRQVALVASILEGAGHPGAPTVSELEACADHADAAVASFTSIHESAEARRALAACFRDAMRLAGPDVRAQLASFQGHPLSSSELFHRRLVEAALPYLVVRHVGIERAVFSRPRATRTESARWRSVVGFIQSAEDSTGSEEIRCELGVAVTVMQKAPA